MGEEGESRGAKMGRGGESDRHKAISGSCCLTSLVK